MRSGGRRKGRREGARHDERDEAHDDPTAGGAGRRRRPGGFGRRRGDARSVEPREHPGRERGPLGRDRSERGTRCRDHGTVRLLALVAVVAGVAIVVAVFVVGDARLWPLVAVAVVAAISVGAAGIALREPHHDAPFAEEPPAPRPRHPVLTDEPEVRRRQGGEVRSGAGVPRPRHRADRARTGRRSAAARRGRRGAWRRRDRHGGRRRVAGARGCCGERAWHLARGDPGRYAQSLRARSRYRPRRRRRRPRRL